MRKPFRERLQTGVILFDGGMGTEIYNRGVYINRCYDELNLTHRDLVTSIGRDYVNAGADVIETNTFGANRFKLEEHSLVDKLRDINLAGAQIAREAAGEDVYVAGSMGPLGVQIEPLGPLALEEAREAFREQAQALLEGGVDLFILETFTYPAEIHQAILAVRDICDLPLIAQITINDDGNSLTGADAEIIVAELDAMEPDVLGANCSVGPHVMLQFLERTRSLTERPFSIMPNAGKPRNINGRNLYMTTPEYMAEYAKLYIQSGANVVGGCCGTNPEHVRAMRRAVNALKPDEALRAIEVRHVEKPPEVEVLPLRDKSRLAHQLDQGRFVTMVEIVAPRGVSPAKQIDAARTMFFYGIDAINIPDGPRASARMSALSLAVQIQRAVGIETVLHYTCRDRNVIGIQSDLLGAWALGLRNILAITGDPPKLGDYPDATAVFDIDAIGLVNVINRLNHGLDIAGNPIGEPTAFHTGVGVNPGAYNMDKELSRLDWKVDAGAEFMITQPVFDLKVLESFLKRVEHIHIPVIAGLWPLTSLRNALFMNNEVPGCHVPDAIIERFRACATREEGQELGIAITREIFRELKSWVQGVQLAAPFGRVDVIPRVLE